ncbi:hypothetical protein [Bacillus sp. FJAT-27251]|nr:hypothetical protein [Bacillus sp. FJAT-27251]
MEPFDSKYLPSQGKNQIRERLQARSHADFSSASLRRIAFMRAGLERK